MKLHNNYIISPIEMGIIMINWMFGVGILTLARTLANEVGSPDGWISILFSGLISISYIYLYTRLQRNFPQKTYLRYLGEGKMGKWGSKIFSVLFIAFLLTLTGVQARSLSLAVKMYLIDQTPAEVIVAVILLTVVYGTTKGLQGVVHLCLLFTPIILFVILLAILFNLGKAEFDVLLPVMPEGVIPILSGIMPSMFSFIGAFILLFYMSNMKESELKSFPLIISMILTAIIYALFIIISYATFGFETSKVITFPGIELAKEIEIIGRFIERLESLFLTVYIMSIFTTMTISFHIVLHVIREQFVSKNQKALWLSAPVAFCIFIIAFIPNSITELQTLGKYLSFVGNGLLVLAIFLGFFTVWLRKRGKSHTNNTQQM